MFDGPQYASTDYLFLGNNFEGSYFTCRGRIAC